MPESLSLLSWRIHLEMGFEESHRGEDCYSKKKEELD